MRTCTLRRRAKSLHRKTGTNSQHGDCPPSYACTVWHTSCSRIIKISINNSNRFETDSKQLRSLQLQLHNEHANSGVVGMGEARVKGESGRASTERALFYFPALERFELKACKCSDLQCCQEIALLLQAADEETNNNGEAGAPEPSLPIKRHAKLKDMSMVY